MKKKISLILVAGMVAASLAGCGSDGKDSNKSTKENNEKKSTVASSLFNGELEKNVTIQVLENDTAISKGYFQELIDAFNEKYAEYGMTAVDANMNQYLDLANDGPYGYGPDVLYQANDVIMRYAEGKHILPIPVDSLDCYSVVADKAWEAYKVNIDGQEYTCGVPVNVQSPMLYYRADLLPADWKTNWDKDNNDVPDMVENWSDMYKYSKSVHEADSSKYGYMKSIYDVYFSSGFLFSYGGYVFGNNNTDVSDIGFAAGEAEKGANVLYQLATAMNEDCIDDTITTNAYSKLADGTYFATISTPDTYSTFLGELELAYENQGKSKEEAQMMAEENLVMTVLPKLPANGDLEAPSAETIDSKMMGGINGYAISSYTKCPNACLAFVDFATSFEMEKKRNEMLGITPTRSDAAVESGGVTEEVFKNLENGNIVLMPSVKETSQIWTPGQTFFTDLAKDAFRSDGEKKYKDQASMKKGLEDVSKQIHDAIFTLD